MAACERPPNCVSFTIRVTGIPLSNMRASSAVSKLWEISYPLSWFCSVRRCASHERMGTACRDLEPVVDNCLFPPRYKQVVFAVLIVKVPVPHPSVREIGVIGVPDGCGAELVQAHVVLKESRAPIRQEQLIDFARMHLAEYKVPDQIIFSENLPYGPTGKIDRKTLRENALGQIERQSYDSRHLPDDH